MAIRPLLLLAAVSLAALSGCRDAEPTSTADNPATSETQMGLVVRIGSFSEAIDYAPYLVARDQGWFEEALDSLGATVSYTTFEEAAAINESFATGRVDVVFEAEPPALIGKASGTDLRIPAVGASLDQEIIVPASSSARSVADLSESRIAVLRGSSSHYNVLSALQGAGVASEAVEIRDMVPPDAKAAFETGQVDAWAVWPPWTEQELVDESARVLEGSDARIHSVVVVRGEFMDRHSEIANAILRVVERSKQWIAANPAEAQAIMAETLNLDPAVVELAWPKHDWTASLTPEVLADIQAKADFLLEQGLIREAVDARSMVPGVEQPAALSPTGTGA